MGRKYPIGNVTQWGMGNVSQIPILGDKNYDLFSITTLLLQSEMTLKKSFDFNYKSDYQWETLER